MTDEDRQEAEALAAESRHEGASPPKRKRKARGAKPPAGRRSGSEKGAGVELRAKELAAAAAAGDFDALKAMEKIIVSFERWKKALMAARDERDATAKIVGAGEAALGNAIEEPLESGSSEEAERKLRRCEVAWQDLAEAKAEREERNAAAADAVKKWANTLERAMREGAQLTLPGTD